MGQKSTARQGALSAKALAQQRHRPCCGDRRSDYDAPVARYSPEFAQAGKEAVTVRQLLGHQAGLVCIDEKLALDRLRDPDDVAVLLARQRPAWVPGTARSRD